MNTYTKYCPNVWVAQCTETHKKGDEIIVTTKHGKENECIVWNYLGMKNGLYLYSITRADGFNSQERARAKAERYEEWADKANDRSNAAFERSNNAVKNIPFGQPILVGHHSEKTHRAALKEELNKEREKIFNEGVRHGRNLLLQLNNGEISINDFYKVQPYKKGGEK